MQVVAFAQLMLQKNKGPVLDCIASFRDGACGGLWCGPGLAFTRDGACGGSRPGRSQGLDGRRYGQTLAGGQLLLGLKLRVYSQIDV